MMDQKELKVQRALGTLDTYWIAIEFPRRGEPVGLGQLVSKVMPIATRSHNGLGPIFMVEATLLYIDTFMEALTILLKKTDHNRGCKTWVHVYEPSKYGDITIFCKAIV